MANLTTNLGKRCTPFLERSYITEQGVRSLLQHLPFIQHLQFPGTNSGETVHLFLERSYITEQGVRSLLQHLPLIQHLQFPGTESWETLQCTPSGRGATSQSRELGPCCNTSLLFNIYSSQVQNHGKRYSAPLS